LGGLSGVGINPPGKNGGMKKKPAGRDKIQASQGEPHRVRLPGFLLEEEIGLGDVVKRITYAMGIKPCGGCEKRAATLNQWMHFSR
jgi:hypothetical protein